MWQSQSRHLAFRCFLNQKKHNLYIQSLIKQKIEPVTMAISIELIPTSANQAEPGSNSSKIAVRIDIYLPAKNIVFSTMNNNTKNVTS